MPVLKTIKMEKFAQLVAKGHNASEAARLVGYSKERASAQGCNLRKHRKVAARIAELVARADEHVATAVAISMDWVIQGLIRNIEEARAEKQFGVVRQCYVDIGKHLGGFIDRVDAKLQYPSDIESIPEKERGVVMRWLAQLAYPDDPAAAEAALQLPAGDVIDTVAETQSTETVEASEESGQLAMASPADLEVAAPRSWADITDPDERKRLAAEWKARGPAGPPPFLTKEERLKWLDQNWPLDL